MDAYRSGQFNLDQLDMIIIEHDFFLYHQRWTEFNMWAGGGFQVCKVATTNSPVGLAMGKLAWGGALQVVTTNLCPCSCSLLSGNVSS